MIGTVSINGSTGSSLIQNLMLAFSPRCVSRVNGLDPTIHPLCASIRVGRQFFFAEFFLVFFKKELRRGRNQRGVF
jgi:hypothetical protein